MSAVPRLRTRTADVRRSRRLSCFGLAFRRTGRRKGTGQYAGRVTGKHNLAEVLTKLSDKGVPLSEAVRAVSMLGLEVIPFDETHARASSAMRLATRAAGLSLGDRACLALALTQGIPALTAERRWPEIAAEVGVIVEVIR